MTTQKFTFWKDNRTDQEFTQTEEQLKNGLIEWMKKQEKSYLAYYCTELIKIYITAKDGLSAAFEFKDIDSIMESLTNAKWEYLNSIGIK